MTIPLVELYRSLHFIRLFEERVAEIYPTDRIKSPVHLSIGQEAISVGVCAALRDDDFVSGTYRGHAAYLAKGGCPNKMMAEMFGKATGAAGGKGGSMHLIEPDAHVIGASAVVGTTIPVAVGHALAIKQLGGDQVVACFFGDGATEEGCFTESLNFASLHQLPVLFICENNGYAIHEPLDKRWATNQLCERVETYDIPATKLATTDTVSLYSAAKTAIEDIRRGGGPRFLECLCYRLREHVGPNADFDQGYRDLSDARPWIDDDALPKLAARIDDDQRNVIEEDNIKRVQAAVDFADQSPTPDPAALFHDVYAD